MAGKNLSLSLRRMTFGVSRKFTLNLDLRWDFNGRYHEKYGHWSSFDTTATNPLPACLAHWSSPAEAAIRFRPRSIIITFPETSAGPIK